MSTARPGHVPVSVGILRARTTGASVVLGRSGGDVNGGMRGPRPERLMIS